MAIIPVEPFDYVVFGGTGDLAVRKIYPALYQREKDGQLPVEARIIGVARSAFSAEVFIGKVKEGLKSFISKEDYDPAVVETFLKRFDYLMIDATSLDGYEALKSKLEQVENRIRVFYLATAPFLFGDIAAFLDKVGLSGDGARLVLEKPLGHDLESSQAINDKVGTHFKEDQIYRIDHYLGKETVQNLLVLRFSNVIFEHLWNSEWIDHVQITVSETVGLGSRAGYYDKAGAMRDMLQNHILQLLCLVAMEPPRTMEQDAVRDEKLKILRSLKPITEENVKDLTVRGQYRKGIINEKSVPSYEDDLGQSSFTETFVAIKAEVGNWRWAGVPFYLRTGKCMAERRAEIAIRFRKVPHSIFPNSEGSIQANTLVIRLQPDEGMSLHLMTKVPGPGGVRLQTVPLDLSFSEQFPGRHPDAYERLLLDVVRGNSTLFMRDDEVRAAWSWVDPIIEGWKALDLEPKPYAAGSWGPPLSSHLIAREGRSWHEDMKIHK